MMEDDNWKDLIPDEVAAQIDRIDGVERLKVISD